MYQNPTAIVRQLRYHRTGKIPPPRTEKTPLPPTKATNGDRLVTLSILALAIISLVDFLRYCRDAKYHKDVGAATRDMKDTSLGMIRAHAGRGYQDTKNKRQALEREYQHNEAVKNGGLAAHLEELEKNPS
ncbi:hypothetical protein MMC17_007968 [Xylographa soralifera]|nr:hypothetical protein [Xylographa soralifera]